MVLFVTAEAIRDTWALPAVTNDESAFLWLIKQEKQFIK